MATLHVLCGPPGSGKSTTAKDWRCVDTISPDQIRTDRFGGRHDVWGDERQFAAWRRGSFEEAIRRAAASLQAGIDVAFDITACLRRERENVLSLLGQFAERKIAHIFRTPLEVCLARNAARDFPVPAAVVRAKFESLWAEPPALEEGFDQLICAPVCIRWRGPLGAAEAVFSASDEMSIQLSSLPTWTKAEGEKEVLRLQQELGRAFPASKTEAPRFFMDAHTDATFAITWRLTHPAIAELRSFTDEWAKLQKIF